VTTFEFLAREIGLDAASIGPRAIELAVDERRRGRGVDPDEYEALLASDPTEVSALIELVVVPETWFLRDREPFLHVQALARRVVAAREGPFRVLSAPCSTGEEPYSLAVALLEAGVPAERIVIDAVDVSERALEKARVGRYRQTSFRAVDEAWRDRNFEPVDALWSLRADPRRLVRFARGNLVDPALLALEKPYDVVCCRNLLIYLTGDARKLMVGNLERLLARQGHLILGHADGCDLVMATFAPEGSPGSFAYVRRQVQNTAWNVGDRAGRIEPPRAPRRPPTPAGVGGLNRDVARPAVPRPTRHATHTRPPEVRPPVAPSPSALLAEARAMADVGRLGEASTLCETALRQCPSATGYTLLGIVRAAEGRLGDARACFERALYLHRDHHEALVHLALLRDREGDGAAAQRLRTRAERARAGKES
jgi:chemotaxis protein methyltransferase WspC